VRGTSSLALKFKMVSTDICGRGSMTEKPDGPIVKIAVKADGSITVDGAAATMESVRSRLKRLAEEKGVVGYYREAGRSAAPPEATAVIQAVIENRLPVRLSSRADFSDAIGADGRGIKE
jgi:hypothetical protein